MAEVISQPVSTQGNLKKVIEISQIENEYSTVLWCYEKCIFFKDLLRGWHSVTSCSSHVVLPLHSFFVSCLSPPGTFSGGGQKRRGDRTWFTVAAVITAITAITVSLSWAMSSSGCCHLPGSLCDYSGNAESEASKDSEESDSTAQAQYIAKVTAKDGRPLSTVVKAVSLQR